MIPALPHPTSAAKLLSIAEAALILGVSRRMCWRLLATRAIPAVRVGARSTRIRANDLEIYLSSLPSAR